MKSKFTILTLITLITLSLTACSSSDNHDKLEKYKADKNVDTAEDTQSKYTYLKDITLEDGDATLNIYIPNKAVKRTSTTASGSAMGVSVATGLVSKENSSASTISQEELTTQKDDIGKIKNVKDVVDTSENANENLSVSQINYSVTKSIDGVDTVYPKVCIIKVDKIQDNYYLKTVIDIDNEFANEKTTDVLGEVGEVYGLRLQ